MSLKKDLKRKRKVEETAEELAVARENWRTICHENPQLVDCQANFELALDYTDPLPLTPQNFRLALENENFVSSLSLQPIEQQKMTLISKIVWAEKWLQKIDSNASVQLGELEMQNRLDIERKKLSFKSIPELKEILAELERRENFKGKSTEELRAYTEGARRAQHEPGEFPPLPWRIQIPGDVEYVLCDKKFLIRIARTNRDLFKRLLRQFGETQINQRLQGLDGKPSDDLMSKILE